MEFAPRELHGATAAEGIEPIELVANRDAAEVNLLVRDRGPGVPETALARLGEPFFRPELSRGRATGGFGLGFEAQIDLAGD